MDNKAQGAFEYILLLAGILLIVILVIVILRSSVLNQANQQISRNINTFQGISNCSNPFLNATTGTQQIVCSGQYFNITS